MSNLSQWLVVFAVLAIGVTLATAVIVGIIYLFVRAISEQQE